MTDPAFLPVDEEFDVFMPHPQAGTSIFKPTAEYLLANNKIRIYVGALEGRRSWTLEEDLFCATSDFINATFQAEPHASSKLLLLEEDDPVAFGLFVDWVYTGTLQLEGTDDILLPISLYVLSEKLNTHHLSLEVLGKFREQLTRTSRLPNLEEAAFLYQHTSPRCPLRQFFVKHFVDKMLSMSSKTFANQTADWNMALSWDELRQDVMIAMKQHCSHPSNYGTAMNADHGSQHQRKVAKGRSRKRRQLMEKDEDDEDEIAYLEARSLAIRNR